MLYEFRMIQLDVSDNGRARLGNRHLRRIFLYVLQIGFHCKFGPEADVEYGFHAYALKESVQAEIIAGEIGSDSRRRDCNKRMFFNGFHK